MPELPITPVAEEIERYRCGPMGMAITFGRCGLFAPAWQNCTQIVATDRRLYGFGMKPRFAFARHGEKTGKTIFNVPYSTILSFERADYLLNHALWIRYEEAGAEKQISIEAGLFWHEHISRLQEILGETADVR